MNPKYTEFEMAKAINALWEIVCDSVNETIQDTLKEQHPVIDEIDEFGPAGPAGIGLGRFGAHAVGPGD